MQNNHQSNNHKFAFGAALALLGTAVVTFVPIILQAVSHWESKEQRELTKELTRLQVEEKKMQNLILAAEKFNRTEGYLAKKSIGKPGGIQREINPDMAGKRAAA